MGTYTHNTSHWPGTYVEKCLVSQSCYART